MAVARWHHLSCVRGERGLGDEKIEIPLLVL
jgi:hypothetical protein